MNLPDVRALTDRLEAIESVAVMSSAGSTNAIGRRVMGECIENERPLPSAAIIALEQTMGRGRGERAWYSPAGKGIWATILHTRKASELALLPLEVATAIVTLLDERFGVEARIKWPNDVLVNGKKIAGILIEARAREADAFVVIGTGINVRPLGSEGPPGSTSIEETSPSPIALESAIEAFVETMDRELFRPYDPKRILDRWRELTAHREGDRVGFASGGETIEGTWKGIDEAGRARIAIGAGTRLFAAGDLIQFESSQTERSDHE